MAAGTMLDPVAATVALGSGVAAELETGLAKGVGYEYGDQDKRQRVERQWTRCAVLPVQLVVMIPLPTFSLKEVLMMSIGQQIMSTSSSRDDVPLLAGDTFLANVTFEPAGGSLGVRISGFQAKAPSSILYGAPGVGVRRAGEEGLSEWESDREHTLADIRLPVSLCFGSKLMLLHQILELTNGDPIVLERPLSGPVSIVVARRIVGQGELIAVKGFYGVRLTKLAELNKRLPEWHVLQ